MEEAYKNFRKYVETYDLNKKKIAHKFKHSYRVALLCSKIAESLGLSEEDVLLAETIGLLHDLGRFEQFKQFHSYNDINTMDHGMYANKLLFENNMIVDYYENSNNYEVIKKAIFSHNKIEIDNTYNERELLFSKIIRDADKLDIFFLVFIDELSYDLDESKVSDAVADAFYNRRTVDNNDIVSNYDHLFGILAFTYDINFKYSFEHLKKRKYLDNIITVYKIEDERVRNILNSFINERIDSYA